MATVIYQWWLAVFMFTAGWNGQFSRNAEVQSKLHPFYIAVTEINHNAKDKTLEVSCKMFAEDLEQILEKNYKTTLDFAAGKDKPVLDRLVPDYIRQHLNVSVDDKTARLDYVGFEKEKESVYCYFEIAGISPPKKINVTNQILYDFNSGQSNIIHVMVNGTRQSIKLNYPDKTAEFRF